jgi:hypothetical protein
VLYFDLNWYVFETSTYISLLAFLYPSKVMLDLRIDDYQSKGKDTLILSLAEPLATTPLPLYSAAADTGALVQALLRAVPGKKLIGVNEWLSFRDFAQLLAGVLGKGIEFVDRNPSFDMGDPDLEKDHTDMIGFCVEFGYDGGKVDKSIVQPADLGVPVQLGSVKEWCGKQDWEKVLQVD